MLTWLTPNPASDGDLPHSYLIFRGRGAPDNLELLAKIRAGEEAPGQTHSWRDVTATVGVPYYYKIVSADKAGNRSLNDPLKVAEPLKPAVPQWLSPVSGTAVRPEDGQVQLAWETVVPFADSVGSYIVQYSRSGTFHGEVWQLAAVGEAECSLPLAVTTGIWYWRVKTQFASGVVSYSEANKLAVVDAAAAAQKGPIVYADTTRNVLASGTGTRLTLVAGLPSELWVRIYNSKGRRVSSLLEGEAFPAGELFLEWHGKDAQGRPVPEGLYFIQIKAYAAGKPVMTVTKRVQVVK